MGEARKDAVTAAGKNDNKEIQQPRPTKVTERAIRDLHSDKPIPPMFCKLYLDNGSAKLVSRFKGEEKSIFWDDLKYQVDTAIEKSKQSKS